MVSNDEVERRWGGLPTNEADLSRSSTPSWSTEDGPRDRSNRLLELRTTKRRLEVPLDSDALPRVGCERLRTALVDLVPSPEGYEQKPPAEPQIAIGIDRFSPESETHWAR